MPRIRSLKYDFFINEELAQISAEARLLGLGLTTIADREGRLLDRPKKIKVLLFPFHDVDTDAMLNELQAAHFIYRYKAAGERYIQIINFNKHQKPHPKEADSVIPPCGKLAGKPSREKTRLSREKVFNSDAVEKPCRVGSGSGDGLGDFGSLEDGDFDSSVDTHTDRRLVCVPKSKFDIEQIREFAWASYRLDQQLINQGNTNVEGIRNPEGWAVVAHRSGEFDGIIQAWVDNPQFFEVAS